MPSPPTRRLAFAQSFSCLFVGWFWALCSGVSLRPLPLCCMYYIYQWISSVGVSARARSACAHAAKPALGCLMGAPTPPPPPESSKSCVLQGDKAGRRVCPPELRTPQLCAVLKVQMRQAHGTQDAEVLFVREHLVASALPKRVMVSDRPHLPGLPRVGVLNHPYRWLTWTVKPVSPPTSTGRPFIRVSGCGVAEVQYLPFTPRRCRLRGRRASCAWGFPGRPDGLVFGPSRRDSATSLPGTGERQEHDHAHSAGLRVGSLVLTGLPTDDELLATHAQVAVDRPVEQLPRLLLGELLNVPLLPSQRVFHEPPFQLMRPRYPINTNFPLAFATAYLGWRR
jgi:hypothetical protein